MRVRIRCIYEDRSDGDGLRVLVDRLWPRGVRKADAHVDLWAKRLAPTTELRRWFDHDPSRFAQFRKKYLHELDANREAVTEMIELADDRPVTLLIAARDTEHNHAVVLREVLAPL